MVCWYFNIFRILAIPHCLFSYTTFVVTVSVLSNHAKNFHFWRFVLQNLINSQNTKCITLYRNNIKSNMFRQHTATKIQNLCPIFVPFLRFQPVRGELYKKNTLHGWFHHIMHLSMFHSRGWWNLGWHHYTGKLENFEKSGSNSTCPKFGKILLAVLKSTHNFFFRISV